MPASIVAAFRHKYSPIEDEQTSARLVEVLTRLDLAALTRAWQRTSDRDQQHAPASAAALTEYLGATTVNAIGLDSGRGGDLIAGASIELRPAGTPDASVVAPLLSYVIVPYEPDHGAAQVAGLVALAEVVRPVWGMMSVEPSYDIAQLAALAKGPPRDQRGTFPLLTEDRIRYRRAPWHHDKQIDRGIGGPEWGTFLGPRHLEKLSLEDVRSSGAFAQVHLLAYGGAFLQLTGDPSDSQSERIVDLVARGRVALSAITLDVSAVRL